MHRFELSDEQAHRMLAGFARNYVTTQRVIFSPWYELEMQYEDGTLYQVHRQGGRRALITLEEVYQLEEQQLVQRMVEVTGG